MKPQILLTTEVVVVGSGAAGLMAALTLVAEGKKVTVLSEKPLGGMCSSVLAQGGICAELAARVVAEAFDYLDAPPTRVTGKDVPMPYAANLEKLALPSVDEVVAAVNAVTYRS